MSFVRCDIAFERNTVTGMFRARCCCGWQMTGSEHDVQGAAACHDLDLDGEPRPSVTADINHSGVSR